MCTHNTQLTLPILYKRHVDPYGSFEHNISDFPCQYATILSLSGPKTALRPTGFRGFGHLQSKGHDLPNKVFIMDGFRTPI